MLLVFVAGTLTMLLMYALLLAVRVLVELTRAQLEQLVEMDLIEQEPQAIPIPARTAENYPAVTAEPGR